MSKFGLSFLFTWPFLVLYILALLYWHFTRTYTHWKKKGVQYMKPVLIFGNMKDRMTFKKSFHEIQRDFYFTFKGLPYAGIFEGRKPNLMVLDPELIKCIMVRDFEHFVDRPTFRLRSPKYIQNMLINLKGHEWKFVRQIMTPAFTSGKLRQMDELVHKCADQLKEYLDQNISDDNPKLELEVKELVGRFTLDVIASCAFGFESNSVKEPESEFISNVSRFSDTPTSNRILVLGVILFIPQFAKYLPLSFFNMSVMDYLNNLVLKVVHLRKTQEVKRNDFLQLMIDNQTDEADKEDQIIITQEVEVEGKVKEKSLLTKHTLAAQSIIFLLAGYETSSTLLTFFFYELALNQDIQDQLRTDIRRVLDKHGGHCTYEAIQDMSYLEMVFNETLRMHPPVARVDRVCTMPYTIPKSNVSLVPGDNVHIPVMGLHYDEDYYPEPHKFNPQRFSPEEKTKRHSHVFLPFGSGPRNCIGLRFAMMSTKIVAVTILTKFKVSTNEKTKFDYSKRSMLLKPAGGIHLTFEPC